MDSATPSDMQLRLYSLQYVKFTERARSSILIVQQVCI